MVPRSIPRPNLTPELKKAEKTGPLSFWNRPKRSNNSRDRAKPGSKKVQHSSKFVILSFAGGSRSQNPTQLHETIGSVSLCGPGFSTAYIIIIQIR